MATLRSDYYARYQEVPELVALAQGDGKYDLAKPPPQELGQMIRLPAVAGGLEFEVDTQAKQSLDEVLRDAVKILEWVADHALPSGALAEQVHPYTNEPLSVSPLTWSHATFVTCVLEYLDKRRALRGPTHAP